MTATERSRERGEGDEQAPAVEALKAATVNAADLLDVSSEVGTIEPGKSAELIAVAGDPLQDVAVLKKVDYVMVRGDAVVR